MCKDKKYNTLESKATGKPLEGFNFYLCFSQILSRMQNNGSESFTLFKDFFFKKKNRRMCKSVCVSGAPADALGLELQVEKPNTGAEN